MLTARIREGLATGPASAAGDAAGLATDAFAKNRFGARREFEGRHTGTGTGTVLYIEPTSRAMQYAGTGNGSAGSPGTPRSSEMKARRRSPTSHTLPRCDSVRDGDGRRRAALRLAR